MRLVFRKSCVTYFSELFVLAKKRGLVFFLLLGLFLLLHFVPNSKSKRGEGNKETKSALAIDWMSVDDTGQNNRKGTSSGHDDGEYNSTELGNGVVDEKLSEGGAGREDNRVEGEVRVSKHKSERLSERSLRNERPGGEDTGEDIDAKHHFHRAHFVLENFRLPV